MQHRFVSMSKLSLLIAPFNCLNKSCKCSHDTRKVSSIYLYHHYIGLILPRRRRSAVQCHYSHSSSVPMPLSTVHRAVHCGNCDDIIENYADNCGICKKYYSNTYALWEIQIQISFHSSLHDTTTTSGKYILKNFKMQCTYSSFCKS